MQVSTLQFYDLQYHAVTVFEDELICAADSDADYGDSSVMLVKMTFNKSALTTSGEMVFKRHLTDTPSVLRVMHGGLQHSAGQSMSVLSRDFATGWTRVDMSTPLLPGFALLTP